MSSDKFTFHPISSCINLTVQVIWNLIDILKELFSSKILQFLLA